MSRQRKPHQVQAERDHGMFDAELSGTVLNLQLLRRIVSWLAPYKVRLTLSAVLVLTASCVAVMMEIIISRVLVDYIIVGEASSTMPDLGMIALTRWLELQLAIEPIFAAGILFLLAMSVSALAGHAHRLTLISAIVNALRDLRQDLFAHLEHRPSSFYDKVPTGRIMTRVTNDVEALYEMLRGMGALVGEFVPFLVALTIMLSTSI